MSRLDCVRRSDDMQANAAGESSCEQGPIGIAGGGRVAQALGRVLRERGEPVVAVASRDPAHAAAAAQFIGGARAVLYSELPLHATRVLIAVADAAIGDVAALLAASGMKQGAALHTCGAHGPGVLTTLAAQGVSCASLHPLQTIATAEQGAAALPGSAFGVAGAGPARAWAEQIVRRLDGLLLPIEAGKHAIYHAAAVLAGNYAIALIHAAVALLGEAGVDESLALKAMAPLVRSSVENALTMGPVQALTGPVARGDVDTVSRHYTSLAAARRPQVREFYVAGARYLLELARARGLPEATLRRFEELLEKGA